MRICNIYKYENRLNIKLQRKKKNRPKKTSTVGRRRIKTEEIAKVAASVWGTEFIQFLAAPAILQ